MNNIILPLILYSKNNITSNIKHSTESKSIFKIPNFVILPVFGHVTDITSLSESLYDETIFSDELLNLIAAFPPHLVA